MDVLGLRVHFVGIRGEEMKNMGVLRAGYMCRNAWKDQISTKKEHPYPT